MSGYAIAPEWQTSQWFNTDHPLTLAQLRGRVVVLHTFQMLCPGCVQHGLPQAQRIARLFGSMQVAVIGLHTVFEHHDVMGAEALAVFIHEYGLTFPIGIDAPGEHSPMPITMAAYGLRGTPSLVLIDGQGRMRKSALGAQDDMRIGAEIAQLVSEQETPDPPELRPDRQK